MDGKGEWERVCANWQDQWDLWLGDDERLGIVDQSTAERVPVY